VAQIEELKKQLAVNKVLLRGRACVGVCACLCVYIYVINLCNYKCVRARRATCDENLQSSPHWYPLVVAVQAWENFLEDRRDAAVDMTKRKPKRGILHVQEWIDTIGFVKIFVDDLISRLHSEPCQTEE